MKSFLSTFIGVLICFLLHYVLIYNFPESQVRRILFHYPNGFIFHTNPENYHLIGFNILEEKNLPPINIGEEVLNSENIIFQVTYDFLEYLFISHFLIGFSIWFFIRSGDVLFLLLFAVLGSFVSSNFFILAFNTYYFFFFFNFSFLIFILGHLAVRTKGHDVPTRWYIPAIILSLLVGFLGRNAGENPKIFTQLLDILTISLLTIAFSALAIVIYDAIKYKVIQKIEKKSSNFIKKIILGISIFNLVTVPYLALKFNILRGTYLFSLFFCSFFLVSTFLFLYSNYGIAYLPQQIIFTSAISLFFQTTLYVAIYAILFLLYKYLDIQEEGVNIINLFFLLFVVLNAISIKNSISNYIEDLSFSREKELNKTLQEMTEIIREPNSFKNAVREILSKATQALEVKKVTVLAPAERFEDSSKLADLGIIVLPMKSPIWKYFSKEKDITITSYMCYGSGIREEVYRYLTSMEVQIAYPIFNQTSNGTPTSVILVGEKINKTNFSIAELKFIKECTRLGDLLMQNYSLLVSDIQKKRMEKDLELAQLQLIPRKTDSDIFSFGNIEISYFSLAAMGVSGDYLDFFTDEYNQTITIFLGDVSGHGIGSGYMVSAVKGLVSELMNENYSLEEIFKFVNDMLLNKFPGNLFMSLIGGVYDTKESSFEFINAGHLHPLLVTPEKTLKYIQTPDRVLGVLPTSFTVKKIFLGRGDRLILFTDGVTETFNPQEEIFGIKRLENCILEKLNTTTMDLIRYIIQNLNDFRDGSDLSDDLTILILKRL